MVNHLIGMNRVFAALLAGGRAARPYADHVEDDPVRAFRDSAAALLAAFAGPESWSAPTAAAGTATGADQLQSALRPAGPWLGPRAGRGQPAACLMI